MYHPVKHKVKGEKLCFNYLLFDSVMDFNAFVDHQSQQLSQANSSTWEYVYRQTESMISKGSDWYGDPPPKSIQELEDHKTFQGMKLLETLRERVRDQLRRYLAYLESEIMPKPKVDYNDQGLGMFSFDRAAMGMYRLAMVNLNTPMDKTVSQLHIELGRYGLKTSVKKVYAYFKDKQVSYPSVRIYLMAGANANIGGKEMLYVGLACAELVDFLEIRGVAVEVSVLMGTSFRGIGSIASVRVKRFQDKLDKNQMLLMSSDPKYFRYRGFKADVALCDYFGLKIPTSLGSLAADMGKDFVESLGNGGYVFEQSYSLDAAAGEVSRIIENYQKRLRNGKAA